MKKLSNLTFQMMTEGSLRGSNGTVIALEADIPDDATLDMLLVAQLKVVAYLQSYIIGDNDDKREDTDISVEIQRVADRLKELSRRYADRQYTLSLYADIERDRQEFEQTPGRFRELNYQRNEWPWKRADEAILIQLQDIKESMRSIGHMAEEAQAARKPPAEPTPPTTTPARRRHWKPWGPNR